MCLSDEFLDSIQMDSEGFRCLTFAIPPSRFHKACVYIAVVKLTGVV
jgi:hypothetical protein